MFASLILFVFASGKRIFNMLANNLATWLSAECIAKDWGSSGWSLATASNRMFDIIMASTAAASTRTQWWHLRQSEGNKRGGKNCWGCKWCHALTHVICLAIFGCKQKEEEAVGGSPGRAGQGLGAHTNKIKLLIYCWHEQQAATMEHGRAMLRDSGEQELPSGSGTNYSNACVHLQRRADATRRCCSCANCPVAGVAFESVEGGDRVWKVSTVSQTRVKNLLTQTEQQHKHEQQQHEH